MKLAADLRRRACGSLAACLIALVACPPLAFADGDPASDVLLGTSVFYPYSPAVAASLQNRLNAVTAAATKAGFPIRVALIDAATDLGVVPELFGKPQQYADFLDQEISFSGKPIPLLVVMPGGYGARGLSHAVTAAVASLRKPAGTNSDALAQAALAAVPELAKAAGHPLAGRLGSTRAASGSGGSSVLPAVILGAAAVAIAAAVLLYRNRPRS